MADTRWDPNSRPLAWGHSSRRVCWLVGPSIIDVDLPHDYTLQYELHHPYQLGRPGPLIIYSIDREEVQAKSIELHLKRIPHVISTKWKNPAGETVKKNDVIRAARGLPPKQPRDEYGYL